MLHWEITLFQQSHVVINRPPSGAKHRRAVQERRRALEIHECCVSISN